MQARLLPTEYPLTAELIAERSATWSRVGLTLGGDDAPLVIEARYPLVADSDLRWVLEVLGRRLDDAAGRPIAWSADGSGERRSVEAIAVEDGWWLALAEQEAMLARVRRLCEAGVRVRGSLRLWIGESVVVEPGATLWSDITLLGDTRIAAGAEVRTGCWLSNTSVAAAAIVEPYSVCEGAEIGVAAHVGPMAHLRPGARLGPRVKVGNFVEVKNTTLHAGAKASHLTYLGDAEIGEEANVGAGTITCNYDGYGKHRTVIGARAFVGSNTSLVAPVAIGAGAIVGAGSVITDSVPDESLAVARAEQRVLRDKAPRVRARNAERAGKKP